MQIDRFRFGSIRIDGETYEQDVVIDRGKVKIRKKKPSKRFREDFGHTPLSAEEKIPWKCSRLVVGTGAEGSLPVMPQVLNEARRRGVELVAAPTQQAIKLLAEGKDGTNAILHITC
ncbi:MAG TPA: MTH938/NDUFAF3 family protein [Candidatus Dormibacteraeota bacterium]|nr:MTH938/NDUFAF3 family protein [Candidatus Dormibacteraeota bacterium]